VHPPGRGGWPVHKVPDNPWTSHRLFTDSACRTVPNLEHGWDTGCTHPGEGGGLSTKFRTIHGLHTDCSQTGRAGPFPNLEHGWDARCTRPGEGGGLSTKFRTIHGLHTDCSQTVRAGPFPNLEHGWDTGCTHPGEGGGLSGSLWTVHGQAADCSHQPVKHRKCTCTWTHSYHSLL
jgi:hypothetical protein